MFIILVFLLAALNTTKALANSEVTTKTTRAKRQITFFDLLHQAIEKHANCAHEHLVPVKALIDPHDYFSLTETLVAARAHQNQSKLNVKFNENENYLPEIVADTQTKENLSYLPASENVHSKLLEYFPVSNLNETFLKQFLYGLWLSNSKSFTKTNSSNSFLKKIIREKANSNRTTSGCTCTPEPNLKSTGLQQYFNHDNDTNGTTKLKALFPFQFDPVKGCLCLQVATPGPTNKNKQVEAEDPKTQLTNFLSRETGHSQLFKSLKDSQNLKPNLNFLFFHLPPMTSYKENEKKFIKVLDNFKMPLLFFKELRKLFSGSNKTENQMLSSTKQKNKKSGERIQNLGHHGQKEAEEEMKRTCLELKTKENKNDAEHVGSSLPFVNLTTKDILRIRNEMKSLISFIVTKSLNGTRNNQGKLPNNYNTEKTIAKTSSVVKSPNMKKINSKITISITGNGRLKKIQVQHQLSKSNDKNLESNEREGVNRVPLKEPILSKTNDVKSTFRTKSDLSFNDKVVSEICKALQTQDFVNNQSSMEQLATTNKEKLC